MPDPDRKPARRSFAQRVHRSSRRRALASDPQIALGGGTVVDFGRQQQPIGQSTTSRAMWMEVSGHRWVNQRRHYQNPTSGPPYAYARLRGACSILDNTAGSNRRGETTAPRTVNHPVRAAGDWDIGPDISEASIIAPEFGRLPVAVSINAEPHCCFLGSGRHEGRARLSRQEGEGRGDPKLKEFSAQPCDDLPA